jgi:hypothetical protein
MELEDLKSIWKSNAPQFEPKRVDEIALMLKGRSMSIIEKLKRNVWLELIFTMVVTVGLLPYAISLEQGAVKWTSISLLLMCLGYTFYYVKKLILLTRFEGMNENLRDNISTLIKSLTGYLRFYKSSYAVLYPVFFALGLLFGALERGTEKYLEFIAKPTMILFLLLMAGLFFFISTWFASWYLKKLYGRHLEKLKKLLEEIQDTSQPV